MATGDPTFLSLTPVLASRADEFEELVDGPITKGIKELRPDLAGFQTFRSTAPEVDGAVQYAFLFHGGKIEDWSLEPLISEADLARWGDMNPSGQRVWSLTELAE